MDTQRTLKSQSKFEEKDQSQKYHIPWLQIVQQKYNNQNSVILAQNRDKDQWNKMQSRNKPLLSMDPDSCGQSMIEKAGIHNGEKQYLQGVVLGKLNSYM